MSEEQSQEKMENLGETVDTLKTINKAFSDSFHESIIETDITHEKNTSITENNKITESFCNLTESQKIFAKCQLNFHLTNGTVYQNTILIHPSKIEELKQNITLNIEKQSEVAGLTNLLCITGSENNDLDFCLLPLKFILYFELKVLFLSKAESATDEKNETKEE